MPPLDGHVSSWELFPTHIFRPNQMDNVTLCRSVQSIIGL